MISFIFMVCCKKLEFLFLKQSIGFVSPKHMKSPVSFAGLYWGYDAWIRCCEETLF